MYASARVRRLEAASRALRARSVLYAPGGKCARGIVRIFHKPVGQKSSAVPAGTAELLFKTGGYSAFWLSRYSS